MAEKITINPITGKFNLIADTAQVEADIDQLKTNLVGKKTPEGGEIFNNSDSNQNTAGRFAHAEGENTTASGSGGAHAEGYGTTASGQRAHAEGNQTQATANNSHSEGDNTKATGECSHAEGYYTQAKGQNSHAEGNQTIASTNNQHVFGAYNSIDYQNVEIVGNGQDANNRSNARTLDWNGNQWVAGKHTQEGTPTDPKDLTTKAYVDNLVSTIQGFKVLVVEALPTADIDEHAIYLVPKAGSTPDNYDEYLYTAGAWEHIGNTDIDLSQYATTADLQNAILQEASNRTTAIATAINSEATARQQADTEILQNVETLQTQVNQLNPTRFFGFSNFHNSYTNTYVKIATLKITAETSTGTPHHGEALAHVKLLCYNSFAYSMETTPEVKSVDFDLKAVFVHAHRDTYLTLKINSIQGLGADAVQFICVDLPPQPQNPVGNNNQLPNPATYIILAKCEKPYDRYFYNIQANTNCEGIELLPETEEQPTLTWYDYINNSNYRKAVVKLPQTPLYNFRSSTNLNNGQTETTFGGCNTPEKHFIFYNGTLLSSYYYEYQNNKYSPDTCTFTIKNRTVNEGDKLTVIY